MFKKSVKYIYGDNDSEVFSLYDGNDGLVKTASYADEISSYLKNLERKEGKVYGLVNAMSAGEAYGCFFKDQNVVTEQGPKKIQDIVEGEKVLTHNKRFMPVIKTFNKNYGGEKISLKIQNMPEAQTSTASHPFWVITAERITAIKKEFCKEPKPVPLFLEKVSKEKPKFLKASEIRPGDYVLSPYEYDQEVEHLPLDMAYLSGYYLSEGCLAKEYRKDLKTYGDYKYVVFVMNLEGDISMIEKLEKISSNYERSLYMCATESSEKTCRLELRYKDLAKKLDKYFGHHSKTKYIHPDIFGQSREWKLKFLGAYLDGDGCLSKNCKDEKYENSIKYSTVSRTLALDLQKLLASLGIISTVSLGYNKHKNGCFGNEDHKIYEISIGSSYTKELLEHTIRLKPKMSIERTARNGGFYILPNGYMLLKVKGTESIEIENTDIYNLEVEEDNTYIVDFIGHNSNRNGDFFGEEELISHHKTFEEYGHVYKHHVNKNPEKAFGRVVFSHYNNRMRRVELILELDNTRAKDIIIGLQRGELPAVSMGTKVPYDVCSICKHKAKRMVDYCDCLKYKMNKVLSDGRRVYAINIRPRFFDISIVTIPAEKTASFMEFFGDSIGRLIASVSHTEKTADWGEEFMKAAEMTNMATIKKEVITKIEHIDEDPKALILKSKEDLGEEVIEKLSEYPLNEVLSTMLGLRIVPTKEEFQKIALSSIGLKDIAEKLESDGIVFEVEEANEAIPNDIILDNYNEKVAELLSEKISSVSLTKPLILGRSLLTLSRSAENGFGRVLIDKEAEVKIDATKNPIVPLALLGSVYRGYTKVYNETDLKGFSKFVKKHPWIFAALLGSTAGASVFAQRKSFEKMSSTMGAIERGLKSALVAVPTSYYASGIKEEKARKGKAITGTEDFVRKHPMLAALAGTMALSKAGKTIGKWSSKMTKVSSLVYKLDENELNAIYNDLVKQ